MSEAVTL